MEGNQLKDLLIEEECVPSTDWDGGNTEVQTGIGRRMGVPAVVVVVVFYGCSTSASFVGSARADQ